MGKVDQSWNTLFRIALNMGIQNSMFITYRGMLVRTTHFTGYLSDAGFELGRAISGNRESLKKVSFCYIVMGLSFLDMRHEVYKYEKK